MSSKPQLPQRKRLNLSRSLAVTPQTMSRHYVAVVAGIKRNGARHSRTLLSKTIPLCGLLLLLRETMTRACLTPGSKYSANGSRRTTPSRGVVKSHRPSSPGRSFKSRSTAQCLQILRSLLPNARKQTKSTELELVEETIAYIAHLESVLRSAQFAADQAQPPPSAVASATQMMEDMTF